jgi:hypothetical protein
MDLEELYSLSHYLESKLKFLFHTLDLSYCLFLSPVLKCTSQLHWCYDSPAHVDDQSSL